MIFKEIYKRDLLRLPCERIIGNNDNQKCLEFILNTPLIVQVWKFETIYQLSVN